MWLPRALAAAVPFPRGKVSPERLACGLGLETARVAGRGGSGGWDALSWLRPCPAGCHILGCGRASPRDVGEAQPRCPVVAAAGLRPRPRFGLGRNSGIGREGRLCHESPGLGV